MDCLFYIQENPLVGKCLVANSDIRSGSVIIDELPIVDGLSKESDVVCLGCYSNLDEDPECCDFCGLLLCSEQKEVCQISARHQPECRAIQTANARAKTLALFNDPELLHEVILVLRILSLEQDELHHFMGMEANLEVRSQDSEIIDRCDTVSRFVIGELGVSDVDTIFRICSILDTNSFEVPMPGSNGIVQAVYKNACLMEHNCIPNTIRYFKKDLSVKIRAACDINKDVHVTCTYTDSLWTTMDRRAHLLSSKYFECSCIRCMDPSECGTCLSSLRCSKCPVGHLLSTDPLDPSSDWNCEDCGFSTPARFVTSVNAQVSETVTLLEQNLQPESCQKFLLIHGRVLHERHASMIDVKHSLLHLLGHWQGQLMADLDDGQLQLKEELARQLVALAEKLLPGISRLKGTSLYELFLVYQQRALNWQSSGLKSKIDILAALKSAKSCLASSLEMLQFEPVHQAEGKLFLRATEELEMLSNYIEDYEKSK